MRMRAPGFVKHCEQFSSLRLCGVKPTCTLRSGSSDLAIIVFGEVTPADPLLFPRRAALAWAVRGRFDDAARATELLYMELVSSVS